MRHRGVDKEETRQRVREAVGRGFREHGYAGVGVDALAKAAGVTSGAFYAHCGSKEKAFAAALADGLDEVIAGVPRFQRDHGEAWLAAFADYYLGAAHRADRQTGCAMAALTAEVTRFPEAVRSLFEEKMAAIVAAFAEGLRGDDDAERRSRAWGALSALIGGVSLSRALRSDPAAEAAANAARAAALAAGGATRAIG